MCEFFSFLVHKDGRVLALLGEDREMVECAGNNPDSHAIIADAHNVNEDECWKYEIPISSTDEVTEDGLNALLGKMKYDGGLPEGDITLSYVNNIQRFLRENVSLIKEAAVALLGLKVDFIIDAVLKGKEKTFLVKAPRWVTLKDSVLAVAEEIKRKHGIHVIVTPKRVPVDRIAKDWVVSLYKHSLPNAIVEENPELKAYEYRVQVLPIDDIVE